MASYVILSHYTHQGIEHVKQSPDRVDALKKIFNKHGAKIKDFYALLGQYDSLLIVDAPNDETVAKLCLHVAEQGNVRIETHRAFTETEFRKLLSDID
ncbi:MAG TPA: GYD domain-containing protein [Candidatus Binataceae bacterium]